MHGPMRFLRSLTVLLHCQSESFQMALEVGAPVFPQAITGPKVLRRGTRGGAYGFHSSRLSAPAGSAERLRGVPGCGPGRTSAASHRARSPLLPMYSFDSLWTVLS